MHICSIFKWENYYNSADFFKWEVRFQKAAIKKAQNQQISLPKTLRDSDPKFCQKTVIYPLLRPLIF